MSDHSAVLVLVVEVLVSAHPVTAGLYIPLPIMINNIGATFATAGGASGTLLA